MKKITSYYRIPFTRKNLYAISTFILILFFSVYFNHADAQTLYVSSGGTVVAQNTAVYIAANATVTDGGTPITAATVSISSNFLTAEDVLSINGTTSGTDVSIAYSYNATTGILTLSGATNAADYQTTLRKVTYTNTSATPTTASRVITFSLNSALPFTGTGHFYEYVSGNITWPSANTAANSRTYFGLSGYLVTVTSAAENAFCAAKIGANACWLGGTAASGTTVAEWRWSSGPEAGVQFWSGVPGTTISERYANWNLGEPNSGPHGEDYVQFLPSNGLWNNLSGTATVDGYVVEYGGTSDDPVLHISDIVTVGFAPLLRNLAAAGTDIKWYDAATGGTLLPATTVLVNGKHYYASQTLNGCESTSRLDVIATVIVLASPAAGTHVASKTQIVWKWNSVSGATGYKWSTSSDYSTATNLGNVLTKTETPLTCNTSYNRYVWAYNASGCVSGVTTLTQTTSACEVIISDIDGNSYNTVTIGTQVWMAENLKTTKYNDGTAIPNITVNADWAAATTKAYSDYSNTPANSDTYGRLYNWYTVDAASNGGKNVCPSGWHVPTDAEWTTLTAYLGGASNVGGKLKETGINHWTTPNTGATNETGFTALPGGRRKFDGTFESIGNTGYWWSSTESTTSASYWDMYYFNVNVYKDIFNKAYGLSVRCLRSNNNQ